MNWPIMWPEMLMERKVYCEVIEGAVYEDRCLFKLSQVIENNKTCENCIVRLLEKAKRCGAKKTNGDAEKGNKPRISKPRRTKKKRPSSLPSKGPEGQIDQIESTVQGTKPLYSTHTLASLFGKSERRTRELAQEGKIPGHKVGKGWQFIKEEVDHYLSRRRTNSVTAVQPEMQQGPEMPSTQAPQYSDPEPME